MNTHNNLTHFDLRSTDYFVEITDGVRINHVDYTLDGNKVMDDDLHIFTLDFDSKKIKRGPHYWVWEDGVADFGEWSHRLNKPADEWDYDDKNPNYLRLEGKTYNIEHADRAWPLPEFYYKRELVGHITTEVDTETGATVRKVQWL